MAETILLTEDFEEYIVPVIYGTGKLYGAGWLYGGALNQDWLRTVHIELSELVAEDFENGSWFPPAFAENSILADDFEDAAWPRTAFSEISVLTDDFEGVWV